MTLDYGSRIFRMTCRGVPTRVLEIPGGAINGWARRVLLSQLHLVKFNSIQFNSNRPFQTPNSIPF